MWFITVVVDLLCALLCAMCHMACPCCALWRSVLGITAVASDDALSWQSWSAFVYPDPAGCVTVIKITVTVRASWGKPVEVIAATCCVV